MITIKIALLDSVLRSAAQTQQGKRWLRIFLLHFWDTFLYSLFNISRYKASPIYNVRVKMGFEAVRDSSIRRGSFIRVKQLA